MPLPYSSLLVLHFIDFFGATTLIYLRHILFNFWYGPSSASSISHNITNVSQVGFFLCPLEMPTRESTEPYFLAYLLSPAFSRPPMVEPGLQHFPTEGYTAFQNCHSSASSFKWDLTSNYSDYTTFVWRVLLPLYFIEDKAIQNNQLNSLSQWWEWRF